MAASAAAWAGCLHRCREHTASTTHCGPEFVSTRRPKMICGCLDLVTESACLVTHFCAWHTAPETQVLAPVHPWPPPVCRICQHQSLLCEKRKAREKRKHTLAPKSSLAKGRGRGKGEDDSGSTHGGWTRGEMSKGGNLELRLGATRSVSIREQRMVKHWGSHACYLNSTTSLPAYPLPPASNVLGPSPKPSRTLVYWYQKKGARQIPHPSTNQFAAKPFHVACREPKKKKKKKS